MLNFSCYNIGMCVIKLSDESILKSGLSLPFSKSGSHRNYDAPNENQV